MLEDELRKGREFEQKVFNHLNPYSKEDLKHYTFKYDTSPELRVGGKSFYILRNEFISGHENDLAVVDKKFLNEFTGENVSGVSIGERSEGYYMSIECKNYDVNVDKRIASDLLAKNYLLKPDAAVIVKEDAGNRFNWLRNFQLTGSDVFTFNKEFKTHVKRILKKKEDRVSKRLTKSKEFFEENREVLKQELLRNAKYNGSIRNTSAKGWPRVINYFSEDVIRLSNVREWLGEAVSLNTPVIVYYKDAVITESAQRLIQEYDLLSELEEEGNRLRVIKRDYDSLEEVVEDRFGSQKRAYHMNVYNNLYHARLPSVIMV